MMSHDGIRRSSTMEDLAVATTSRERKKSQLEDIGSASYKAIKNLSFKKVQCSTSTIDNSEISSNIISMTSKDIDDLKYDQSTSLEHSITSHGRVTSFASLQAITSAEEKNSLNYISSLNNRDNSINASVTSQTKQRFLFSTTTSFSSQQLRDLQFPEEKSFGEGLFQDDSETNLAQITSLKSKNSMKLWNRIHFKFPFRRQSKDVERRRSKAVIAIDAATLMNRAKIIICAEDRKEMLTLWKTKEENDSLKIEVQEKEEELRLLHATLDQMNQNWQSKVQSLIKDVEATNQKCRQLREIIVAEKIIDTRSNSRGAFRVSASKTPHYRRNPSMKENGSHSKQQIPPAASGLPSGKSRNDKMAKKRVNAELCYYDDVDPREKLMDALLTSPNLALLSRDVLRNIVNILKYKRINKGERLMQEGAVAHTFYILNEGECRIFKEAENPMAFHSSHSGTPVYRWNIIGENDFFFLTRRVWSCKCITPGSVWYLTKDQLTDVITPRELQKIRREYIYEFLEKISEFNKLSRTALRKLAHVSKVVHYADGDYIIKQGNQPKVVYVIKEGEVHVSRDSDGTECIQRTLKAGHLLGDEICERFHNNAIAVGAKTVQCIEISIIEFHQLLDSTTSRDDVKLTASRINEGFANRDVKESRSDVTTSASSGYESEVHYGKFTNWNYPKHRETFAERAERVRGKRKKDFFFIANIGHGAFGSVDLVASNVDDSDVYAIKKISKREILVLGNQKVIVREKTLQKETSQECPFITSLFSTFQDNRNVYFVMEYCQGGELFTLLTRVTSFDDNTARFYTGCVIEALTYLHSKQIVFRDLKPENVVVDRQGYCKLTDFGSAKQLFHKSNLRTYTYCGTLEYIAPEILFNKAHTLTVDLWSLGIFIFEIVVGNTPFRNDNKEKVHESISCGIAFPLAEAQTNGDIGSAATSIVEELCRSQPRDRLGAGKNGISEVKNHGWFKGFDWKSLRERYLSAPWQPKWKDAADFRYFDPYNTRGRYDETDNKFSDWDENY